MDSTNNETGIPAGAIAIIGMNGRFPGAQNMDEFWNNLYRGVESVKFFTREELIELGIDKHLLNNPRFVPADAILDGMDMFDASFFDYSAREAEIMDPQHRLFLESAWEVMESAGYDSEQYDGRIGVYAGANLSGYMIRNLYSNPGLVERLGSFKIMLANGQDFLATKVSYKMNLMGPSVNVNTLCSSSLVAVHFACQNLLNYSCDIALAGGVSFQVSRNEAFFYQEGGIGSSDGHCRAFDSKANGTVSGSGLAVVVLKRLEDAIEDNDFIHAVIRGTGINNDGSAKNSYTAPNVDGQAECIAEAIALSEVNPETITYIDAHGTGTDLGDPIEIAALTKAFRSYTKKKQFCAIGSVKTNIGHLVNAGGLASVIKTVLAMKNHVIPPSLNFEYPNSKIDFINSPFFVNTEPAKWERGDEPLRAGVSSFGIGGTNTHVILEEAPTTEQSENSKRQCQIVSLSAKTVTALEKMTGNLADFLESSPELNIADIAFTMHAGRRNFNNRRIILCNDTDDLCLKLKNIPPKSVFTNSSKIKDQPVVFMFPGENENINAGAELYRQEELFRNIVDELSDVLNPVSGTDIKNIINSRKQGEYDISVRYGILFTVEYALAKLLKNWGIEPQYMIGEGTGEYVAACLSGIISPEDALKLAVSESESLPGIVSSMEFGKIGIPFISRETGNWISEAEASSRDYWSRRYSNTEKGLAEILKNKDQILMEIGPGNKMAEEAAKQGAEQPVISSMPGSKTENEEQQVLAECIGMYWLSGGKIDWNKYYSNERRCRIPLPTYPFERQRYWIEPGNNGMRTEEPEKKLKKRPRPELESAYEAPRNEVEKAIIDKWQEVLGFDRIGINDDFFELGGHSLIAAAVATELGKKFDVQIPMRTLFETTTAAGIADLVETYKWASEGSKEPEAVKEMEDGTI